MKAITTRDPAAVRRLYPSLRSTYREAFKGKPWEEVSQCVRPELPNRANCVGQFSKLAIGDLCTDCALRPTVGAYPDGELTAMFDGLLSQGAAFYIERDRRGILMATIGLPETAGELARTKYADDPKMQAWVIERLGGEDTKTTYLAESLAALNLRPTGNMKNRGPSVRSIVAQTGPKLVTTRTISPQVIAATLRDFPDVQLYLPDDANQSEWNAELLGFADRAAGSAPDRRAFLVWNVE